MDKHVIEFDVSRLLGRKGASDGAVIENTISRCRTTMCLIKPRFGWTATQA